MEEITKEVKELKVNNAQKVASYRSDYIRARDTIEKQAKQMLEMEVAHRLEVEEILKKPMNFKT